MLAGRWCLLLFLLGAGITGYGVLVETRVRAEVGGGLHRVLARMFYSDDIAAYRQRALLCLIVGPALGAGALLLRRTGTAKP